MTRRVCDRRVLGWSLFALLLAGLAWALCAGLVTGPRWTRPFPRPGEARFSPDGARVLVVAIGDRDDGPALQIWDVQTGEVLGKFGTWTGSTSIGATSADFHWWAGVVHADGAPRFNVVRSHIGRTTADQAWPTARRGGPRLPAPVFSRRTFRCPEHQPTETTGGSR
jgi:hypothetical protein